MKKFFKSLCAVTVVLSVVISCAFAAPQITPRAWTQLQGTYNDFFVDDYGTASILASTTGKPGSTKVTVEAYVERQSVNGGGYSKVTGMSWTSSSTSSEFAAIDETKSVTRGYTYRMVSKHTAVGPNGTDTYTVYSTGYTYG